MKDGFGKCLRLGLFLVLFVTFVVAGERNGRARLIREGKTTEHTVRVELLPPFDPYKDCDNVLLVMFPAGVFGKAGAGDQIPVRWTKDVWKADVRLELTPGHPFRIRGTGRSADGARWTGEYEVLDVSSSPEKVLYKVVLE